jgi:hypothetical protein
LPYPSRIFLLEGIDSLSKFVDKFKKSVYSNEEIPADTDEPVLLKVSVERLALHANERLASGTFLYDDPIVITHRDRTKRVDTQTLSADFGLVQGGSVHLVIFSPQSTSSYVRARVSPLLVQQKTRAANVRITEAKLDNYLRSHPHVLRSNAFVELTIPHVNKARITGSHIDRSQDYRRYKSHGKSNSIFFTHLSRGWTISISTSGCVTVWQDVGQMEVLRFIRDEVLPLCA